MEVEIYSESCIPSIDEYVDEESVDVVVTSPPYNNRVEYDVYWDNDNFYEGLIRNSCDYIHTALKVDGSLFLNLGCKLDRSYRFVHNIVSIVTDTNTEFPWVLQNTIIWVKSIALEGDSVGHFKPINSGRYLSGMFEYIFHLTKGGKVELDKKAIGVPYKDKSNIKRWKGKEDIRDRGNVWFIPYETAQREKDHPSSFPVGLPEMCIKLHGGRDDLVVMDPFMGTGATALAAKRLGAGRFIGFDVSEDYCEITKEKLR